MTKKKSDNKLVAWISVFIPLVGFILAIAKHKDKYVTYYAKQGFILFLAFIIASIISWIPVVGWLFWILIVILWIMAWINALSEEEKNTWLIGDLANKLKL